MQVEHGVSVLVTDGRKALLLNNQGDADFPNLHVVRKWEVKAPPDRELRSDAPGHVFSSYGGATRRSVYDEGDLHDETERQFACGAADVLNDLVSEHAAAEIVLVAPARTLGIIRKHLSREVSQRVRAQIPKDLVKHPVPQIERLLCSYPD